MGTRVQRRYQAADDSGPTSAPGEGTPGRSTRTARLQRQARDGNGVAAGAAGAVAEAQGGRGAPLPDAVRTRFEGSLGADLSEVRVHTDDPSAQAAGAVGAHAYTLGNDVHFNAGQYQPDNPFGLHLLAHEVAHTVQQAGGAPDVQARLEVSAPGDGAEHEADRAADAMVAGRPAAGLLSPVSGGGAARLVQREAEAPKPQPGGVRWVVFDDQGGWDAAKILARMSQLEHSDKLEEAGLASGTKAPDHLPNAGQETDRSRCGSNASLAMAIAAGPAQVVQLCKNLIARIMDYQARGKKGEPEMPTEATCDRASIAVGRIMRDVHFGSLGGAHEGGSCTLRYTDFDALAHWIYVFSFNPDDPGRVAGRSGVGDFQGDGRRYRSANEIADAAKLAGYAKGDIWGAFPTWEALTSHVDAMADGESVPVLISIEPHDPTAGYLHTIIFFRQRGASFMADSWEAGNCYPSTHPKYKEVVHGAYDQEGGLKPLGLIHKRIPREAFDPSPVLEMSH